MKDQNYRKCLYFPFYLVLISLLLACQQKRSPEQKSPEAAADLVAQKENENIVTVAYSEWVPYSAEHRLNGGPVPEITQEALKRAGYEQRIEWLPFVRCIEMAKLGRVDSIGCVVQTDERKKFIMYPNEPVGYSEACLFALKKSGIKYEPLEKMRHYSLARERESFIGQAVIDNAWERTDLVISREQMLKMLMGERVDLVAAYDFCLRDQFKKTYPDKKFDDYIEKIGPAQHASYFYLAFVRSNPKSEKLLRDFDKALSELKAEGLIEKIEKKHDVRLFPAKEHPATLEK